MAMSYPRYRNPMVDEPPRAHRRDAASPADRRQTQSVDPPYLHPSYLSTLFRAPKREPFRIPYGPAELAAIPGRLLVARARGNQENSADLTRQHGAAPLGERIVVHGRLTDAGGLPVADALIEIWQTNAAGRYAHPVDQHAAPLDPNFTGAGWCITDARGGYRFVSIKPGAYPWQNHANAWRPAHVHFSVLGRTFAQRLVTQMYFPGDPLLEHDPIYRSVSDSAARARLVAALDLAASEPAWALAYRFDIVLAGRAATPLQSTAGGR